MLIASQHGYYGVGLLGGGKRGGGGFMFCLIGGAHIPKEHFFERKPLFEDEGWARNVFLGENKTKKLNARCKLTFLVPPSCSVQMRRTMISISCHKKVSHDNINSNDSFLIYLQHHYGFQLSSEFPQNLQHVTPLSLQTNK